MTIALNMITGPYEEPFLQAAFASTMHLCDEWVFVDTAPGNNPNRGTLDDIAYHFQFDDTPGRVKIIEMPRGEDKDFSFAEARELARVNTDSDWVLRLDADEVLHEDTISKLKYLVETLNNNPNYSAIEVSFYHHMVYPWLFQYIEPKQILFKKEKLLWRKGVHEQSLIQGGTWKDHDIKFHHYGYCRGQEEVFKRWQLYVDIDGRPEWYSGTNPATILDDRISVCQNFRGEHPEVVKSVLEDLFSDVAPFQIKEIHRYMTSDNYVGLLLITYNDAENLEKMLPSLENTLDYPAILHIIDMGSTDSTRDLVLDWKLFQDVFIDVVYEQWNNLESLAHTQNHGFKHLMARQECNYIGWIHPDMVFEEPWLKELVATLQVHPEIGKICSYNTRDGQPVSDEIFDGQEQAYIIRRGTLFQVGLFDESYIGIGGYEDWDMNNRIKQEGLRVAITPKSKVFHKGMATRERRDTSAEQIHNAGVYQKKWQTHKEDAV